MAGVKGRSGGARPNSGPKPKAPVYLGLSIAFDDPEEFLRAVMNDSGSEAKLRIDAAKALMPFVHAKKGDAGKKEIRKEAAESVMKRFAAAAVPPKLVAAGGRKVK
jgi:phage terminase small subunit